VAPVHAAELGLWIEAEGKQGSIDSPENLRKLLEFIGEGAYTDLYVQVYRRGRSFFPSLHADATPFYRVKAKGADPLREIIDFAHGRGIRVHAWLNALRIKNNPEAPLLKMLGHEAVLVDSSGTSLLDYQREERPPGGVPFKLETGGIWLDPSSAGVRRYLAAIVEDLLRSYPDLDGVHLDMIRSTFAQRIKGGASRYRQLNFGYSEAAVARFYAAQPPGTSRTRFPTGDMWKKWRTSQVTLLVFELDELIARLAPHASLSAAVIAWPDRAKNFAMQAWPEWLHAGVLDSAVIMAYTTENETLERLSRFAVAQRAANNKIHVGLGAWMMLGNQQKLLHQTKRALALGADGVALFSYANLANRRGKAINRKLAKTLGQ